MILSTQPHRRVSVTQSEKTDDATTAAVTAALEGLKSSRDTVREAAVKSLGSLGLRAATHAGLLGACAHGDVERSVRMAAVGALGALRELGFPELIRALGADCLYVREAAEQELQAAGEAPLPQLRVALKDKSCAVRLSVAGLIGKQRIISNARAAKACRVAAAELVNPTAAVRGAAADALALLGLCAATHADELVLLMRGEDAEVGCKAVAALGCIESAGPILGEAYAMLEAAIKNTEPVIRLAAAKAVGCLGEGAASLADDAGDVALKLLSHSDWEIKIHAAEALALLGSSEVKHVNATAALMHEDIVEAQFAAVTALSRLESAAEHREDASATAYTQLKSSLPLVRVAAAAVIGSLGETEGLYAREAVRVAVTELVSLESDVMLRLDAARAIGRLGYAAAAYAFWANEIAEVELQHQDPLVRVAAAAAIGSLIKSDSDEDQAAAVAEAELNNKDWYARADAARALLLLGPAAAPHVYSLAAALRDSKAAVRDTAATALASLGREGLGHLAVAMRDVDWKARSAAAKALQAIGYSDAMDHVTINAVRDA